jgi:hypothetical protein
LLCPVRARKSTGHDEAPAGRLSGFYLKSVGPPGHDASRSSRFQRWTGRKPILTVPGCGGRPRPLNGKRHEVCRMARRNRPARRRRGLQGHVRRPRDGIDVCPHSPREAQPARMVSRLPRNSVTCPFRDLLSSSLWSSPVY